MLIIICNNIAQQSGFSWLGGVWEWLYFNFMNISSVDFSQGSCHIVILRIIRSSKFMTSVEFWQPHMLTFVEVIIQIVL